MTHGSFASNCAALEASYARRGPWLYPCGGNAADVGGATASQLVSLAAVLAAVAATARSVPPPPPPPRIRLAPSSASLPAASAPKATIASGLTDWLEDRMSAVVVPSVIRSESGDDRVRGEVTAEHPPPPPPHVLAELRYTLYEHAHKYLLMRVLKPLVQEAFEAYDTQSAPCTVGAGSSAITAATARAVAPASAGMAAAPQTAAFGSTTAVGFGVSTCAKRALDSAVDGEALVASSPKKPRLTPGQGMQGMQDAVAGGADPRSSAKPSAMVQPKASGRVSPVEVGTSTSAAAVNPHPGGSLPRKSRWDRAPETSAAAATGATAAELRWRPAEMHGGGEKDQAAAVKLAGAPTSLAKAVVAEALQRTPTPSPHDWPPPPPPAAPDEYPVPAPAPEEPPPLSLKGAPPPAVQAPGTQLLQASEEQLPPPPSRAGGLQQQPSPPPLSRAQSDENPISRLAGQGEERQAQEQAIALAPPSVVEIGAEVPQPRSVEDNDSGHDVKITLVRHSIVSPQQFRSLAVMAAGSPEAAAGGGLGTRELGEADVAGVAVVAKSEMRHLASNAAANVAAVPSSAVGSTGAVQHDASVKAVAAAYGVVTAALWIAVEEAATRGAAESDVASAPGDASVETAQGVSREARPAAAGNAVAAAAAAERADMQVAECDRTVEQEQSSVVAMAAVASEVAAALAVAECPADGICPAVPEAHAGGAIVVASPSAASLPETSGPNSGMTSKEGSCVCEGLSEEPLFAGIEARVQDPAVAADALKWAKVAEKQELQRKQEVEVRNRANEP
ncbi:hypothetical protein Vretifemale_8307 [Volvox reticuliferus]|uniref:Uncharacterized protein n=1 Tax=Volvox reticuliferus TaxID=1737510 RepID=A0A8J4FKJ4_9CHLO|nr:hypothetical protein Vretifemale_8307 [Volvox reticuliferus]